MSAREKIEGLAWYLFAANQEKQHKATVDAILAEHAHELAEKIRAHPGSPGWEAMRHDAADLIDQDVHT